ncbi:DNA topoisomerase [Haloarcula californiae icosahedral virus 1]|uniref:Uncharacterized protein n=1 Tax=Haloarcula californiae icosahedral virus 1 TaxID=1735722 RepID=A0A1B0TFF9_9VIRU|nr:DNA topoisomerase [Haloarcula californiae icosahedral virus 1]ALJ99698.1 hypothetical protein SS136_035 [Haloarcula californiae icosahedral virus 1]
MSDGWNPGAKYQMYLRRIQDLLTDEKRTVRDVYYALEARGFESELNEHGHAFKYRYVKRAVKKGRRHGYIDPALIIDESRRAETTVDEGHESPEQFVDAHVRGVWNAYRENFWNDQGTYLEIWLEKQSLASIFRPIAEEFNVRLEATRGDWSDSKVYEATQRLRERIQAGDDVVVLYFGDFNPSGYHAPVSVQETMGYYGIDLSFRDPDAERPAFYFDVWPLDGPAEFGDDAGTLLFDRRGINLEHIERFDLPENPNPSSTDKDRQLRQRFQQYVSDGRDVNVELNALKEYHRDYLEDLVRDSIREHIDQEAREATDERVRERQERLSRAICVDDDALGGGDE